MEYLQLQLLSPSRPQPSSPPPTSSPQPSTPSTPSPPPTSSTRTSVLISPGPWPSLPPSSLPSLSWPPLPRSSPPLSLSLPSPSLPLSLWLPPSRPQWSQLRSFLLPVSSTPRTSWASSASATRTSTPPGPRLRTPSVTRGSYQYVDANNVVQT